ncbi:MAG TPA: cytochrome P450 [Solirubrobacteraceae bacterium]|jgi:cytochrome P450|nr:cytochrome P450 [Solirubrobacteraceae bacterium]
MPETAVQPAEALAALSTEQGRENPYPIYDSLRTLGPVIPLGPVLVLVGYDECATALRDKRLLSTDASVQDKMLPGWRGHSSWRWLTQLMLFTNDPVHARQRRFNHGPFTPRRVIEMRPMVERIIEELIERLASLANSDAIDFMSEFAFRVPLAVQGELLGITREEQLGMRDDIADVARTMEPIHDLRVLKPGDAAMDRMAAFFEALIEKRRAAPGDDLLSAMVQANNASKVLSGEAMVANFLLLFEAGIESPTDLIGNSLRLALAYPEEAERLVSDPQQAHGFVAEVLRFDPPVHALSRMAGVDLDVAGVPVKAGTKITLLVAAANRDPRRFENPELFDPDRREAKPLTFGLGPHYCIGAALATMESEIALPRLLRRFPEIALAGMPSYREQIVMRGYDQLPVTLGEPADASARTTAEPAVAGDR